MIEPEPLPAAMRPAGRRDLDRFADVAADAFSRDPFNLWMVGGNVRAMRDGFRAILSASYIERGQCFLAESGGRDGGAAAWIDSRDLKPLGGLGVLRWSLAMLMNFCPGAIPKGSATGEAMDAAHPKAPHLYLFLIGTAQSARGKGLGKALMQPMLAACDRDGLPCYLESSDPANYGFYRAHGFEISGDPLPIAGAPPLVPMWREPR